MLSTVSGPNDATLDTERPKCWRPAVHFQSKAGLKAVMDKSNIIAGGEYGIREKRTSGTPLERVRVLQHIRRNKWKAKWIEPNPGLIDYVESAQIVVPWKEHKAFLKDEENAQRLADQNQRDGYKEGSPIALAVEQVFESVGESLDCQRGVISGTTDAFDRIRTRAKVPNVSEPAGSYQDRLRTTHWPFRAGLELARAFCAAEPSTVLVGIEATERQWATEASRPGEEYVIPLLNQYRPSWALIRQWTGHDPAIAEREAYIETLQRLVWDAIYALQKAGLDSEANRLRRVLQRDKV